MLWFRRQSPPPVREGSPDLACNQGGGTDPEQRMALPKLGLNCFPLAFRETR